MRFVLLRVRADTTNALVWQKSKLHAMELRVTFALTPITSNTTWEEVKEGMETKQILCDIHVIKGTASGNGMVGMIEAHLDSVGGSEMD